MLRTLEWEIYPMYATFWDREGKLSSCIPKAWTHTDVRCTTPLGLLRPMIGLVCGTGSLRKRSSNSSNEYMHEYLFQY
jgi:hypothetical protein